jgi:hypothetical protein
MSDRFTHALVGDQTTAGGMKFGCALFLIGAIGMVASILVLVDEGFTRTSIVLGSATLLFLLGGVLSWTLWIKLNQTRLFPMDCLGTDGEQLLYGTCSLRWDTDEDEKLEPGRYRLAEFSDLAVSVARSTSADPITLTLFVSGAEDSRHFQVQGFGLRDGEGILLEPSRVNVLALTGDEALVGMDTQWGTEVPLLEGLHRIERVVRQFPGAPSVEVLVVSPTAPDSTFRFALAGLCGRLLDVVTDEMTRRTVQKMLERDLVRDRETGESLMGFCEEHGWGVRLAD